MKSQPVVMFSIRVHNVKWRLFLMHLSPPLIGQQKNVSCVASGGCGGYGRGQRSCQSVLGSSELSGARL